MTTPHRKPTPRKKTIAAWAIIDAETPLLWSVTKHKVNLACVDLSPTQQLVRVRIEVPLKRKHLPAIHAKRGKGK